MATLFLARSSAAFLGPELSGLRLTLTQLTKSPCICRWVSGSDCQRLGDFICEMCKQREETIARQKEIAARAGGAEAKDYTPDEPPTHYVFMCAAAHPVPHTSIIGWITDTSGL